MIVIKKSKEFIEEIKSNEGPELHLHDFWSSQELSKFQELADKSYSDESSILKRSPGELNPRSNLCSFPNDDIYKELEQILYPKLKNLLKREIKFSSIQFFKVFKPFGIHVDSGIKKDQKIFYQGVIPLSVPENEDAYTILMNEKCYQNGSFMPYECESFHYTPRNPVTKKDYHVIEGYNQSSITEDELNKYWKGSDFFKNWLDGFSVKKSYLWKENTMFLWNRSQIHCGSPFIHPDSYKVGLLFLLEL